NYDLQLGLGALQQRYGAAQEAQGTYRAVVERDPTGPHGVIARDRLATIAASARRYDEALPLLAESLKINPRDTDALTLRGNIALERRDAATAVADLRAVLREHPDSIPVLRTLARAHLANGEPALAEEKLRAALTEAPGSLEVRTDLAELMLQT